MKYNIDGIKKSKIIKSTQTINKKDKKKAIIVNYLDGTQDVFELNDTNLSKIEELAEQQGKIFAQKKEKRVSLPILKLFITIIAFIVLNPVLSHPIIKVLLVLSASIDVVFLARFLNGIKKNRYLKKYQLYFNNIKENLDEYKEILESEKQLVKNKNNVELNSVLDLDKMTLKQVENVKDKIERYQAIDKQKVKIKKMSTLEYLNYKMNK